MNNLVKDIKRIYEENNYKYTNIKSQSTIKKIHSLIFEDIFIEPDNAEEYHNYAICYNIKENGNIKNYYLMEIEKGNSDAMYNFGRHFVTSHYDKIRYYIMASEKGHSGAMNKLALEYKKKREYDKAIKYYLMAIKKGNSDAMNNIGYYYMQIGDHKNMMKYYVMAIERDNISAMYNLGYYYNVKRKNRAMSKTYYLMAIKKGHQKAMHNLGKNYYDEGYYKYAREYYLMAFEMGILKSNFNSHCLLRIDYLAMVDKLYDCCRKLGDFYNLVLLNHYKNDNKLLFDYFEIYISLKSDEPFDNKMLNVIDNVDECYNVVMDWACKNNHGHLIKQIRYYVKRDYFKMLLLLQLENSDFNKLPVELIECIVEKND